MRNSPLITIATSHARCIKFQINNFLYNNFRVKKDRKKSTSFPFLFKLFFASTNFSRRGVLKSNFCAASFCRLKSDSKTVLVMPLESPFCVKYVEKKCFRISVFSTNISRLKLLTFFSCSFFYIFRIFERLFDKYVKYVIDCVI